MQVTQVVWAHLVAPSLLSPPPGRGSPVLTNILANTGYFSQEVNSCVLACPTVPAAPRELPGYPREGVPKPGRVSSLKSDAFSTRSPHIFKWRSQQAGYRPGGAGTEVFPPASSLWRRGEGLGGLTSWQTASPDPQHKNFSVRCPAPSFCLLWGLGRKCCGLTAPRGRSALQARRTGAGSAVRAEPLKSGSNILQSSWKPTGVLRTATDIHINPEHFVQVHTVGSLQSYK